MSKKYWAFVYLATFILLPGGFNGCLLLHNWGGDGLLQWLVLLLLAAEFWGIYRFGKKAPLPGGFLPRYAPFIAPIVYVLLAWLLMIWLNGGDFRHSPYGLFAYLPFFFFVLLEMIFGADWTLPLSISCVYLLFMAFFALGAWYGKRPRAEGRKKGVWALALIALLSGAVAAQSRAQYHSVLHPDAATPELREDDNWPDYRPFTTEGNKLAAPKTPPALRIQGDYPRLVGATALVPVYAAAANAIYQADGGDQQAARAQAVNITNTSSPAVYRALIEGTADIVFAAAPSQEQLKDAAAHGLTYAITPIGREAFVFLVNDRNPVKSLTVQQIRGIYSGRINDWRDLGGPPGAILPFQRNAGSGSQTAMERVMGGLTLRQPLQSERVGAMGGLVRGVANYRNSEQAIGYSFRYYATTMNKVAGIRLLAVDQIAPTPENIRNGSYPFTGDIVMVTARPLSPNAQKLRDWFLSDEGQQLIEAAGYVPLRGGAVGR